MNDAKERLRGDLLYERSDSSCESLIRVCPVTCDCYCDGKFEVV